MALKPGETVTVSGDTYDALSYKDGMACISAIEAAVGSAEKDGTLKKVGAESGLDQKHAGTIRLTRYIQNLARSPGGTI